MVIKREWIVSINVLVKEQRTFTTVQVHFLNIIFYGAMIPHIHPIKIQNYVEMFGTS